MRLHPSQVFMRCAFVFLSLLAVAVHGRGVSPYLPQNISPILEHEVERLVVIAGMPNLTKPYSLASILYYLHTIEDTHPRLYARLSAALAPYQQVAGLTHARASVTYADESHPVANGHGNYTDARITLSLRAQWQVNDWLAFYAGTHTSVYEQNTEGGAHFDDDSQVQATGSTLSLGRSWAQLDIGYRDIWLSPFQGSAQLLSTHGQTLPSIALSNNLPIEFLDARWHYSAFVAQMARQPVLFNGRFGDEDKPLLAGLHLSVQLTPWWSLGASRVFQFGGGERPVDLATLVDAVFDPRGADNDATVDEESGNQIAALSSRIHFDGSLPFSVAMELAGEDTSNNKAYQLGNTALTIGVFVPYFFSQDLSLNYEYSDWQDAWYVNNLYARGYSNAGFVAGHWAMQAQQGRAQTVEGRAHFLHSQWQTALHHVVSLSLRYSDNLVDDDPAWEVDLSYALPFWGVHTLTLGLYVGEDSRSEGFSQMRMALEW